MRKIKESKMDDKENREQCKCLQVLIIKFLDYKQTSLAPYIEILNDFIDNLYKKL